MTLIYQFREFFQLVLKAFLKMFKTRSTPEAKEQALQLSAVLAKSLDVFY